MKLLFCPDCHDVHGLVMQEWRMCLCGASGGQYNRDGMTATVGGKARVFGVGNPFFNELYSFLAVEGKRKVRQAFYGQPDTDAWWGEYDADQQILRIKDANGPRLQVRVRPCECGKDDCGQMTVVIVDKREHWLVGKSGIGSVTVPKNPMVKITRWDRKKKVVKK